jgi:hypothetical protein
VTTIGIISAGHPLVVIGSGQAKVPVPSLEDESSRAKERSIQCIIRAMLRGSRPSQQ